VRCMQNTGACARFRAFSLEGERNLAGQPRLYEGSGPESPGSSTSSCILMAGASGLLRLLRHGASVLLERDPRDEPDQKWSDPNEEG